jgi:prephenate dehydrogenase
VTPVFPHALIVGVGMIGGSVAAALRAHGMAKLISACGPGDDPQTALAAGLIDQVGELDELMGQADLIVLACPPSAMEPVLGEIGRHRDRLRDAVVITDCASTKQSVIASAYRHLGDVIPRFVPGHPIAGSEQRGPGAARGQLFHGARWIVCPQAQTATDALQTWTEVLAQWGCRVQTMAADEHDTLYAAVSHMPHAVAFALCSALARSDHAHAALVAAGAGLKDTTRIGASDAALWADIVMDNRLAVQSGIKQVISQLHSQLDLLDAQDRQGLQREFAQASTWRRQLRD